MARLFKNLDGAKVEGRRVLVRVDWNVTLGKALQIVDDTRILRTLPTIKWLLKNGAKQVIIMTHLGKPKGKESSLSVLPIAQYASQLLGEEIELMNSIEQCHSDTVSRVMMLENLRFFPGEELNDPKLAEQLAGLGEIYVNEAFGESHREAASIVGIPKLLPAYAGFWLVEEVEAILKVRDEPEHPFVVVVGGAKVEDKLKLLEELSKRAETILLGGKLANEYLERGILLSGKARVLTPSDGVGRPYLDIGEQTIKMFAEVVRKAKTIVWNGPMGKVEEEEYRGGTWAVFEMIANNVEAYTLIGGGDTLAALHHEEFLVRIDHLSTGGGAMLKLLESGSLPGIEVLESSS